MTNDYMNNNTGIKYDHRNLITEITKQNLNQDPPTTYITRYRYDEAGNRTRKTVFLSNEYDPPPLPDDEADLPPGWSIVVDDYYSRDVSGKEIGVYSSYTLQYWNVWSGNEITGRINYENNSRYYYLKDHLGSVRAVIDEDKKVITAQDYDAWGYYLENRMYESYTIKNKFTGKERDNESTYDYFGARYFDSRVGRWGGVEPLLHKYYDITPYGYSLQNPLRFSDNNGKEVIIKSENANQNEQLMSILNSLHKQTGLEFFVDDIGKLSVSGEAKDYSAEVIKKAIENKDIIINLILISKDIFEINGENVVINVGTYNGSEIDKDGKVQTSQYFNIVQAKAWEKAGGSEVGISVIHEIKESFIGGVLFAGEPYGDRQFNVSHFLASATDPQRQYIPQMHREGPRGSFYYKNKEGEKIYFEY